MAERDESATSPGTGDGRQRPDDTLPPGDGTGEPERPDTPETPAQPSTGKPHHTRTGGTWAAVVVATVMLIVLLIFILQNLRPMAVTFLWMSGNLPAGVALLLAAAIGGLLVAFVGAARILQLRRTAARDRKQTRTT